jgi:hypothetical protein
LKVLRRRLVEASYDGGRGLAIPKHEIRQEVEIFCRREIDTKSLKQLKAIESIPRAIITPQILQSTGLLKYPLTTEKCTIYYKHINVSRGGIEKMAHSNHRSCSLIGQEILDHTANGDTSPLHILTVGRLVHGVKNRISCDAAEQFRKLKSPNVILRPWVEALFHSGLQPSAVNYWVLSDLTYVTGGERSKRLVGVLSRIATRG